MQARMAVIASEVALVGLDLGSLGSLVVGLGRAVEGATVEISRTGEGGYSFRSGREREVREDSSLCQIINQHLLPLAYLTQPGLVVVAVGEGIPAEELEYSLHQLRTLAAGRMILIQNK